jgi:protein phosphatase
MPARLNFESAARTHVGCVRELNEDNFVARPEVGLWGVADGMGGHEAGDVASTLIVSSLEQVDSFGTGYGFLDDVHDSVQRVNRTLLARAAALAPGAVIGSTIVVLLAYEGHYACLWAGDSRCYLFRGGVLEQITRDHSMVQELIDSGSITRDDAKTYHRANVITRAVGVTDRLALDMHQGPIEPGDLFVLCSDGLTGMVADHEIAGIVSSQPLELAADALLELTLERGGRDNVTFILVQAVHNPDDTVEATAPFGFGRD